MSLQTGTSLMSRRGLALSASLLGFLFSAAPVHGDLGLGQSQDVVQRRLNQNFNGISTLHLAQLLNLHSPALRGRQIQAVILRATSQFGNGSATVLVNQMDHRSVNVDRFLNTQQIPITYGRGTIGGDIQQLALRLRGNIHVESVGVRLVPRGHGGPGGGLPGGRKVVRVHLGRDYHGNGSLRLVQVLPEIRSQFNDVNTVTVLGYSAAGNGRVRLCGVNRCTAAQILPRQMGRVIFRAEGIGLENDQALRLEFRGNIHVETLMVLLERQGPGNGGGHGGGHGGGNGPIHPAPGGNGGWDNGNDDGGWDVF